MIKYNADKNRFGVGMTPKEKAFVNHLRGFQVVIDGDQKFVDVFYSRDANEKESDVVERLELKGYKAEGKINGCDINVVFSFHLLRKIVNSFKESQKTLDNQNQSA